MILKKSSMPRATVKKTYRNSGRKHGGRRGIIRNPSMRFSSLDHFQRTWLSNVPLQKNDELSSWKSLFFYRCTDEISFAPLKSQGIDSRLKYIRDNTVDAAPSPCSPKSIYVLATLVRQPPTNLLTHETDVSTLVGNLAPTRRSPSRYRQ